MLLTGCTETERFSGEGALRMKVSVDPYVKVVPTRALTSDEQATLENNCEIRIYSGKGLVRYYKGLSQMPEELQLTTGDYKVQVTAGDSVPASFDKSYYKGAKPFEIMAGNVTNQEVKCKIANVLAAVTFSSNIDELFKSYTMTVYTKFGSLDFTSENIGAIGYYMLSEGEASFNWKFVGVLQNEKEFVEEGRVDAAPATHYNLQLNFSTDGYEDGGASLQLTVQETPLETVEDEVEIKQRPSFRGVGFDFASPYMYALNATNELSFKIAVTSALESATLSCDKLTEWGFNQNTLQLASLSEEDKIALSANGLQLVEAFDPVTQAGILTVTMTSSLIQKMTIEEASYSLVLSAADAEGLSNTKTLLVLVSDASVLTKDVNVADVWTSKAQLIGELIKETSETLSFNYRIKGEANWQNIEAVRKEESAIFTADLTNLREGTEYEYQALSGNTPSAVICRFTTEAATQLPNYSFENWSMSKKTLLIHGSGESMFWDSGNHGSSTMSVNVTSNSTEYAHTGSNSAKLQSQFVGFMGLGKFAAGNLFVGKYLDTDGTDGILGWGREFSSRPKALRGYIRYVSGKVDYSSDQIASGAQDQGIVYIALCDKEKEQEPRTGEYWPYVINTKTQKLFDPSDAGVIAYGEKVYDHSTDGNGLIEFIIDLDYRSDTRKPTSIVVVASASRYGDYFAGSSSSVMWLDDLELIYE